MSIIIDCDGPVFDTYQLWDDQFRFTPKGLLYFDDKRPGSYFWAFNGDMDRLISKKVGKLAPFIPGAVENIKKLLQFTDIEVRFVSRCPQHMYGTRFERISELLGGGDHRSDVLYDFAMDRINGHFAECSSALIDDNFQNIREYVAVDHPVKGNKKYGIVWCSPENVQYWAKFRNTSPDGNDNVILWAWNWANIYNIITDIRNGIHWWENDKKPISPPTDSDSIARMDREYSKKYENDIHAH